MEESKGQRRGGNRLVEREREVEHSLPDKSGGNKYGNVGGEERMVLVTVGLIIERLGLREDEDGGREGIKRGRMEGRK
jgi:hypothetical protein